jgi:type II secretory pathway pseudopilin PulG
MQERFSKFPFLKFRIPHFAFPNQITPSCPWRPLREPISRPHAKSATFTKDFSDQKNNPFRPLRPLREPSAFSLTEVVIAMGVAAVAFTSIIALFPLGLNMSKESYEATQAALIAQTIMADLKDEQSGAGNLRTPNPGWYRLLQISPNSDPMGVKTNYVEILIKTVTPQTAYIAYKPNDGANNDTDTNNPLMMRPYTNSYTTNGATAPDWYNGGTNGAFALVKVTISPTFISDTGGEIGPRRIDMSVETPGSANVSNRTCYLFTGAVK